MKQEEKLNLLFQNWERGKILPSFFTVYNFESVRFVCERFVKTMDIFEILYKIEEVTYNW